MIKNSLVEMRGFFTLSNYIKKFNKNIDIYEKREYNTKIYKKIY